MKKIEIIRIAFNNLKANKMRSLLTILGISVGIATIVFLVSLGYGLQQLSIKKIASIEAINTLDVSVGKGSVSRIDNELIEKLKQINEIGKVSPLLSYGIKGENNGKTTDAVGNFIDDDYASLEGVEMMLGAFFSNVSDQMVVSTAFLKSLDIETNKAVNQDIKVVVIITDSAKNKKEVPKNFKIIGVVQDDSTSFCYIPILSMSAETPKDVIYNTIKVKVNDRDKITSMGYSVSSIADTIGEVQRIFSVIQIILAFFGLVALIVASIGMFNTMTIALLERTRDIGIMKSLGVKDKDISKIFLFESAIIATSGGLVGVFAGYLTAEIINFLVNLLAKSVGGEPQRLFSMPALYALIIIVFSSIVGLATGFYPSKRASRLNPLDALRYE